MKLFIRYWLLKLGVIKTTSPSKNSLVIFDALTETLVKFNITEETDSINKLIGFYLCGRIPDTFKEYKDYMNANLPERITDLLIAEHKLLPVERIYFTDEMMFKINAKQLNEGTSHV